MLQSASSTTWLRSVVTAIEVTPIGDFLGRRNWGYDGTLPYTPDSFYGRPEDFKALVEAAHSHRLMMLLDVVYNHFGPEGRRKPSAIVTRHSGARQLISMG